MSVLANLADEVRESYMPNREEHLPYLGLEHIKQDALQIINFGYASETKSHKFKFKQGDILFGTLRPYFRKLVIAPIDGVCSTELCVIRVKDAEFRNYIFYKLAHPHFIEFATQNSNGARPRTKWKFISMYELNESLFEEDICLSNEIASTDALIVNNRRRIELLEESARLLYREWFVYFRFPGYESEKSSKHLPDSWRRTELGTFALIKKGKNITKDTIENGDVPVVAGGLSPAYFHSIPNAMGPVITISASGANAGYTNLYFEDIWASDCSYLDSTENSAIWFLYNLIKASQSKITSMQIGAAQPHVYTRHLNELEVIVPPKRLRMQFQDKVDAMYRQIANLLKQNKGLAKARDLLLPRLMDGRIEV